MQISLRPLFLVPESLQLNSRLFRIRGRAINKLEHLLQENRGAQHVCNSHNVLPASTAACLHAAHFFLSHSFSRTNMHMHAAVTFLLQSTKDCEGTLLFTAVSCRRSLLCMCVFVRERWRERDFVKSLMCKQSKARRRQLAAERELASTSICPLCVSLCTQERVCVCVCSCV